MLELKKLTVHIKGENKTILENVNLQFKPGKKYTIMGPNGSGKSTLVKTIMGDEKFKLSKESSVILDKVNLISLPVHKRAQKGLFLSMQSPISIPGITVFDILRKAIPKNKFNNIELKNKVLEISEKLQISENLLKRSLNDGFSGGERKKMEILQMALLDPKYIMLDEIDTGVDVDALKIISNFIEGFTQNTNKTLIIITHYNRILKYLNPDTVIVIKNKKVIKTGDISLSDSICKSGFGNL